MDEATNTNNKHVLTILCNYYDEDEGKIILEQLASVEVVKVDTESLYVVIENLFEENEIPWTNLVSVLMDSCAVMRGCKNGLEKRLRDNKAPHLLDIDGDVCHHMHNGSKKFCAPFEGWVEDLMTKIHTDNKYCNDLRDYLLEICEILGIPFTVPERFLSHRWLSAYDVGVSTLRLWDAYRVFYYSFISKDLKPDFWPVVADIMNTRKVSRVGKERVKEIQKVLAKKKMTKDGQARKKAIVEKVMFQEQRSLFILHFYTAVLPMLKEYVLLFQSKEPMVHLLHDKQEEVFKQFLSCYVKQEEVIGKHGQQLTDMHLSSDQGQFLNQNAMFTGKTVGDMVKSVRKDDPVVADFMKRASAAYIQTGSYLQKKLPLNNKLLRRISALDPTAAGHSASMSAMKKLGPVVPCCHKPEEADQYELEVHRFHVDKDLPDADQRLDVWWGQVSKGGKYPALCKLALAVATIFHGPLVEASFYTMGDIINNRTTSLAIQTYSAIQTIKYFLKSRNKSAIEYFARKDVHSSPVDPKLCLNMKTSSSRYRAMLKERKDLKETETGVMRPQITSLNKTKTLLLMRENAKDAQVTHLKKQKKAAKQRLLTELVIEKRL